MPITTPIRNGSLARTLDPAANAVAARAAVTASDAASTSTKVPAPEPGRGAQPRMPRPGPRRPIVAVRLSEQGIAAVDKLAETEGVNRSEMIRRLLSEAVAARGKP